MNAVFQKDVRPIVLPGGLTRRVLAHTPQMMMVEVVFPSGGQGSVHTHPHAQSTRVLSGIFRFTAGNEEIVVRAGDTLSFSPDEPHGCLCLEAGVLLDVFSPAREDFLQTP